MANRKRIAKIAAVAAAPLLAATLGTGTANASPSAGYIGAGYTNNPHGVWCAQHNISYWFHTSGSDHREPAEDGSFGPETKQAIKDFQEEMGLPQDGVLGPQTGNALMAHGDPAYTGSDMPYRAGGGTSTSYCYTYLPTTW
ncbi:peptidoglycan-binding protein [Kitasatospora sp. NPDC059648]|uniref:peptidoglycan-binding domain-containing protein n=1 Tax=Kitasatospora sp. NPDC059648 TaxID=3346894 RepID=UPI00367A3C98